MPLPTRTFAPVVAAALTCMVGVGPAAAQDGQDPKPRGDAWDQERFEEKAFRRAVEQGMRVADSEGQRWLRELSRTYPGKVGTGLTEEDVKKWYDVLAGDAKEWRRDAAPNRQVADLFDRLTHRLELGPVPSVRRDEYWQFARRRLVAPPTPKVPERPAEADHLFRVLDRDGSGFLEQSEWTGRMRTEARKADPDGDHRVEPKEFQAYFEARVTEAVEAGTKAIANAATADRPGSLPSWFRELDTDGDGQIGLYEWRTGERPINEFKVLDLDGDGLLTPDEYRRHTRAADAARKPADLRPRGETPPGVRAEGPRPRRER